jgi:acetyltransferase EpsM
MTKIALIGGGGFAKEVCEIANLMGHQVVGYVGSAAGVIDYPYWGDIDQLADRRTEFDAICVAFGAIDRKSLAIRAGIITWLSLQGFKSIPLISPYAVHSSGATVADGAFVAHGAVLSVDARIGAFSILNTNAVIGHDANIGHNAIIAPGAFIGGNAVIGENSLIGPGAIVLEGRAVGSEVIVGLGGTVVRNVKNGSTVMPMRSRVLT